MKTEERVRGRGRGRGRGRKSLQENEPQKEDQESPTTTGRQPDHVPQSPQQDATEESVTAVPDEVDLLRSASSSPGGRSEQPSTSETVLAFRGSAATVSDLQMSYDFAKEEDEQRGLAEEKERLEEERRKLEEEIQEKNRKNSDRTKHNKANR